MDGFLKQEQRRLRDMFNEFDRDANGALDSGELARFVRRLIPEVTKAELHYFQVGFGLIGAWYHPRHVE